MPLALQLQMCVSKTIKTETKWPSHSIQHNKREKMKQNEVIHKKVKISEIVNNRGKKEYLNVASFSPIQLIQ